MLFTIATEDADTFAYGSLVSGELLHAFDIVAGERSGGQARQKRRVFLVAEQVRQNVHADISADELQWHTERFLSLPANADSVEMPLQ